jgi:hypothetical protein
MSLVGHLSKMAKVALIHPQQRIEVSGRTLVQKSDLFAEDLTLGASPYTLKTQVSLADFQEFVAALEGKTVTIKNDNFRGLSQLCQEFGFQDLATQLSQFRESGDFKEDDVRLSALEERMERLEALVARVALPLSTAETVRSPALPPLEADMRTLKEAVAALEERMRVQESLQQKIRTEVERSVGEVRSEVENVREALREVRHPPSLVPSASVAPAVPTSPPATPAPTSSASVSPPPSGWKCAIVSDFPKLFEEFKTKQFTLLWRGSRDGFRARDFHCRCDGHPNTLTVILDTHGNIFGGFTPVEWKSTSGKNARADPSLKSFVFTLKNPHNVPTRRFALKAEKKDKAIDCGSDWGPHFCDIAVSDNCNANTRSWTALDHSYTNDTGLHGKTFFTGWYCFQVKEIEVFEITN